MSTSSQTVKKKRKIKRDKFGNRISKRPTSKVKKKYKLKRVLFPWIKTRMGRTYKCMIAVLSDRAISWSKAFKKDTSVKKIFLTEIYPELEKFFPEMERKVIRYYRKHGRDISKSDVQNIVYGRLNNLYKFDRKGREIHPTREHPSKSEDSKLSTAYDYALKLYKKNKSYQRKSQ